MLIAALKSEPFKGKHVFFFFFFPTNIQGLNPIKKKKKLDCDKSGTKHQNKEQSSKMLTFGVYGVAEKKRNRTGASS